MRNVNMNYKFQICFTKKCQYLLNYWDSTQGSKKGGFFSKGTLEHSPQEYEQSLMLSWKNSCFFKKQRQKQISQRFWIGRKLKWRMFSSLMPLCEDKRARHRESYFVKDLSNILAFWTFLVYKIRSLQMPDCTRK